MRSSSAPKFLIATDGGWGAPGSGRRWCDGPPLACRAIMIVALALAPGCGRPTQEGGSTAIDRITGRAVVTINTIPWSHIVLEDLRPGGSSIDLGETPIVLATIPAGEYALRASRDRYEPLLERVSVAPGDRKVLSRRLSLAFEEALEFTRIDGTREVAAMKLVAIVIGPGLEEPWEYPYIVEEVRELGRFDAVLLFSYVQGSSFRDAQATLRQNLALLARETRDVEIAFFHKNLPAKTELELLVSFLEDFKHLGELHGEIVIE